MKIPRILIVEDEHALALALAATVRHAGAVGDTAATAARARQLLEAAPEPCVAMVLDIGLPDQNGLEFLASLPPAARPPTLVVTAHGEIQNTIAARKLGVVEFLTKPLDFDELSRALDRLLRARRSRPEPAEATPDSAAFIGAAAEMRPVFQQIAHCCASDDPVLVRGDTGTGKSHVARLIQSHGLRAAGPAETMVAAPSTTAEELAAALGRAAEGGLVIEEVGLLGAEIQAELVRRIETARGREFPRLVATTRDDLRARVAEGAFRSDLFYRLQVLEVRLPPLRERMEDLPALVSFFVGQLEPERKLALTETALARLGGHGWPGNLRELRNALAFALTVGSGASEIDEAHLPDYLGVGPAASGEDDMPGALVEALDAWLETRFEAGEPAYRDLSVALEATLIRRLLRRYDGKLARTAAALGANRTTLRRKLRDTRVTSRWAGNGQ
jgi:DNA-binding NtrC family response regulator